MENTTTHTDQDNNNWQFVIGIKAYRRAIRKDHSARNRNACPWCESTKTLPYEQEGEEVCLEAPERVCLNCFFIYPEPADSPQDAAPHQG